MNIILLLQEILGPYKRFSSGENYFQCPFCHSPKRKFAINEHNLKWHCWQCGSRGTHVIWLLKNLNLSKEQINRFKRELDDVDISTFKDIPHSTDYRLSLPPEYKPLWVHGNSYAYIHALSYLKSRGITPFDVLRYRLGFCEEGKFSGRIVLPSYDNVGNLNYFTARTFYDSSLKYKNPPTTKNVVAFENMIDWSEQIILCEGLFDAMAIRRNAIPLLGKTLPSKVELALLEHKVKHVTVFLDADARSDALEIETKLKQYGINVTQVVSDKKDPSDMGFDESWGCVGASKPTQFKELIEQRLSI